MFKPLSFFIGLRYTGAKRRNQFISLISLISVAGLALGVATLIVVLSVMNGFDRELQYRILGMVPHAVVWGHRPIEDWESVAEIAEKHPKVMGAAPYSELQVMLAMGGRVTGSFLQGIDPVAEQKVSILGDHMHAGHLEDLQPGEFGIVIGYKLARQLAVGIGDSVTVVVPEATVSAAGVIPRFKRFKIIGVFKVGAELDGLTAFIHHEDMSRLARRPGTVAGVRLKVSELFEAGIIGWQVQQEVGDDFYTTTWERTHGTLWQAIKMEKAMMGLLLILIVGVAAFNIVSSLVMLVTDKRADIAVLRTLGASPRMVMSVFMVQGMLVGVGGVLVGVALGVFLALNIADIAQWLESVTGVELFGAYFVNFLPSQLRTQDVLIVGSLSFLISFLATIYPAWQASRVQPAEALRYE